MLLSPSPRSAAATRRTYGLLACVPLTLWLALKWYLGTLDAWPAWNVRTPLMVIAFLLSVVLGAAGVRLWWDAGKRGEPILALAWSTVVASGVLLYYLYDAVRVVIQ